jgi:hypothetical protein
MKKRGHMKSKIIAVSTIVLVAAMPLLATEAQAEDAFDIEVQATLASDNMEFGLTETDHNPWGQISVTPSYGIFYGNVTFENKDFGPDYDVDSQLKAAVGFTPEFGDLSVDFNLQRRIRYDDRSFDRWLPFVTATYKFSEQFSASLGGGYYAFDDASVKDFAELYAAIELTPNDMLTLNAEMSYDFNANDDGTGENDLDYLEVIGSATITLPQNFSFTAKLGWEDYMSNPALASYVWYDVGIDYKWKDHVTFGVHYQGNDLDKDDPIGPCGNQAFTDCNARIYAQLTLTGKLSDLEK